LSIGDLARTHVLLSESSDVALLSHARFGDEAALAELLRRHGAAVQPLADRLGPDAYDRSWDVMADGVTRGETFGIPVRAAWLSALTGNDLQGLTEGSTSGAETIWSTYLGLSDAWQIALWHHQVEGDKPVDIAPLLGLGETETVRALVSASIALRRSVALKHPGGDTAACLELIERYRHQPPMRLNGALRRELREHGRHCDQCLGFIRDVFTLEFGLRETLASSVLGQHADGYLALRRKPARIRIARTPSATSKVVVRRIRPVLATAGVAGVAMAATAVLLVNPYPGGPGSGPAAAGAAVTPGTRIEALTDAPVLGPVPPAVVTSFPATPTALDGAATAGTHAHHGQQQAPEAGGPGTPVVPPTQPSDGTSDPISPVDPPSTPPPPDPPSNGGGNNGPLDVDVDTGTGQVTVEVDPGGNNDPIVVQTPPLDDVVGDVVDGVGGVAGGVVGGVGGALGGLGQGGGSPVSGTLLSQ
jgi:hypothetical protein